MTTPAAAANYLSDHLADWHAKGYALHNPNSLPVEKLPVIYGFNNGGSAGWYQAHIIAQDGTPLGAHICSHEGYMRADLGVLEGSRPDRHETFRAHYPDGYRMDFVSSADFTGHEGLSAALAAYDAAHPEESSK